MSTRRRSARRRQAFGALAGCVAIGLAATGCTGNSGTSGGVSAPSGSASAGAGGGVAAGAAGNAPAGRAPAPAGVPAGGPANGAVSAASLTSPALVLTAALSLRVAAGNTVDRAAARAEQIATADGGRVDADNRAASPVPSATIILRIPNAAVPAALEQLAALGRVTDRQLSTADVTTQVVDVASRVSSARAAIATLSALYRQARNVRDVITIETTLSQREADLESLEAEQNALQASTALATVTLALRGIAAPRATARPGRHDSGLSLGWHAFTVTVHAVLTALATALPFGVALLLLAAGALVVRRRVRLRSTALESRATPE